MTLMCFRSFAGSSSHHSADVRGQGCSGNVSSEGREETEISRLRSVSIITIYKAVKNGNQSPKVRLHHYALLHVSEMFQTGSCRVWSVCFRTIDPIQHGNLTLSIV